MLLLVHFYFILFPSKVRSAVECIVANLYEPEMYIIDRVVEKNRFIFFSLLCCWYEHWTDSHVVYCNKHILFTQSKLYETNTNTKTLCVSLRNIVWFELLNAYQNWIRYNHFRKIKRIKESKKFVWRAKPDKIYITIYVVKKVL